MRRLRLVVLGLGLLCSLGTSAFATSVNFSFDTQTINGQTITGLSSGATYSSIQTYMNQVLAAAGCSGCSITVYAQGSSGAVADQTWTGDGNVVGPSSTKSTTLGTTNGAAGNNVSPNSTYDTFISNTGDNGDTTNGSGSTTTSQITLQFSGFTSKNLTINSFDYEIFPDGSCSQLTSANCGGTSSSTPSGYANQPDFKFMAGNGTNGTGDSLQDTFWGIKPGTSATLETNGSGATVASGNDGGSTKALGVTDVSPQAIGTWSGSLTGVSELDFVDWPATIGVDNLQISFTNTSPVPEPAGVALFGTLVLLLTRKLRKAS